MSYYYYTNCSIKLSLYYAPNDCEILVLGYPWNLESPFHQYVETKYVWRED